MKRYGMVIGLREDQLEEYKSLHANAWPDVLWKITECHIVNYTIYLQKLPSEYYLFSHFEYVGEDYKADMARMAEDPITQKWWGHCEPCQLPLEPRKDGVWWTTMEEVFHHD